ncbi:hypothetical protein QFZ46_003810 [Microbacterium murale]|uniref:Uncharacterized protein n=1 Tax=Microbacterium murale TaxID=1081040 RepID=A0ABU0PE91_9MICO|nr:hypothetical protein [Microbacterium murale]
MMGHSFDLWRALDGWSGGCRAHGGRTALNRTQRAAKVDLIESCAARQAMSYLSNIESMTADLTRHPDDRWTHIYLKRALVEADAHGIGAAHPEMLNAQLVLSRWTAERVIPSMSSSAV